MNPNKRTGRVQVQIDGENVGSYRDAEFYPGGVEREEIDNGLGDGAFTETDKNGMVTFKKDFGPNDSTKAMEAWDDVTVICTSDTGQSWVGNHYALEKLPTIKGKEPIELKLFGPKMEERTVG